jgi:hypothetical protein
MNTLANLMHHDLHGDRHGVPHRGLLQVAMNGKPRFEPPGDVLLRMATKDRPLPFVRTRRWATLTAEPGQSSCLDGPMDSRVVGSRAGSRVQHDLFRRRLTRRRISTYSCAARMPKATPTTANTRNPATTQKSGPHFGDLLDGFHLVEGDSLVLGGLVVRRILSGNYRPVCPSTSAQIMIRCTGSTNGKPIFGSSR